MCVPLPLCSLAPLQLVNPKSLIGFDFQPAFFYIAMHINSLTFNYPGVTMLTIGWKFVCRTAFTVCLGLGIAACSGSEESAETETPTETFETRTTREINALAVEQAKLKGRMTNQEQATKELSDKISSLEQRLAEKLTSTPTTTPTTTPVTISDSDFALAYDEGQSLFRLKQYGEAIEIFQELLDTGVNNFLTDNCEYWIGECYYGLRQFRDATEHFTKVLTLYPDSDKRDDALIMLGNSYAQLGERAKARQALRQLLNGYPESEYAARARSKLRRL
jgi:tol-pal system protein YbgF